MTALLESYAAGHRCVSTAYAHKLNPSSPTPLFTDKQAPLKGGTNDGALMAESQFLSKCTIAFLDLIVPWHTSLSNNASIQEHLENGL